VPQTELAQQLVMRTGAETSESVVEPGLGVEELFVDGGQDAAGHEQVAKVSDGAPVRQFL
jgi:hypothetical protein